MRFQTHSNSRRQVGRHLSAAFVLAAWFPCMIWGRGAFQKPGGPPDVQAEASYRQGEKLYDAAERGDIKTARRLLDSGVRINVDFSEGETPLFYACRSGKIDMVRYLLKRGAAANWTSVAWFNTPLDEAARADNVAIIHVLLAHGAKVDGPPGSIPPLYMAADQPSLHALRALIAAHANPNACFPFGIEDNALIRAVIRKSLPCVTALIRAHADPKLADEKGETPISLAKQMKLKEILRVLEHGVG